MKLWQDITQNAEGHYVALDVFKAVSFVVGIALIIDAQVHGRSVEPGVTLLLLAYGLQNSKLVSQYFQRKTADANGALMQAGTETAPTTPVVVTETATTAPTDTSEAESQPL